LNHQLQEDSYASKGPRMSQPLFHNPSTNKDNISFLTHHKFSSTWTLPQ
jgi:hypothetical protein